MSLTRFEFTTRVRPIMEVGIGSSVVDEAAALWDVALWDDINARWNGDEPLWRDVACDVIDAHLELGRGRITDTFPVARADITVDNNSGWADPSIDFEQDSTVGHFSFPGTAGNYISTDVSNFILGPEICVLFRFRTSDWPPPYLTGELFDFKGWAMLIQGNSRLGAWITKSGGGIEVIESPVLTPSTDWRWYAFCLNQNDGAGGHEWKWWYGGSDANPGTWTLYGSGTGAGVLDIPVASADAIIGTDVDDGFTGDISHLSVRAGTGAALSVGGTTVWEFNGWDLRDSDATATEIQPRVGLNPMIVHGTGVSTIPASWQELEPDLWSVADPSWTELDPDLYEWTA